MIKAIIFDYAGVLGTEAGWIWLNKNINNLEIRKDFFNKIANDVDSGKITNNEYSEILARESGKSSDQIWKEIKSEVIINKKLISFIKTLRPKYKIGLLSNFTHPWLSEILTENNLWELFDSQIISSEHKIIKPNPEIFKKMLDMLNIKPEEAVFVDDRQTNIDGAKKVGINAILFVDNDQLIKDLKKFKVEI